MWIRPLQVWLGVAIEYNIYTEYMIHGHRRIGATKMKTDIDGIITELAKKIEAEGRDTIFARFEHADTTKLGRDGADARLSGAS